MSDKRSVKRSIKSLERFPTWQLIVVLVLMVFLSATFLRLNNIGMAARRDAVIDADKAGDQTVIRNRLLDLANYVSAHMNTSRNEVYLEQQYNRDKATLIQKAAQNQTSGQSINAKADAICKPQYVGYSQGYVDCFAREYAKYAPSNDPVRQVKLPDTDRYRHIFVSPLWSPDFAGFSVLACVILVGVIMYRLLKLWVLRIILRLKYKSV